MYMLIPEFCSEHASLLYVLESAAHLTHIPFVHSVTERIIISKCSYNNICDEHTDDILFTFKYN
jgi:hypothetical protein